MLPADLPLLLPLLIPEVSLPPPLFPLLFFQEDSPLVFLLLIILLFLRQWWRWRRIGIEKVPNGRQLGSPHQHLSIARQLRYDSPAIPVTDLLPVLRVITVIILVVKRFCLGTGVVWSDIVVAKFSVLGRRLVI